MEQIKVLIKNKIPIVAMSSLSELVEDNTGYTVKFEFDSEWDAYPTKTVYFVRDDKSYTTEIIRDTDECSIPLLKGTRFLYIGVSSGDLKTTQPCAISVKNSIRGVADIETAPPSADVYDQIIALLNNIKASELKPEDIENAVESYFEENPIESVEGPSGPQGKDGYTPVKGKDYWTDEDKSSIVNEVKSELLVEREETLAFTYTGSYPDTTTFEYTGWTTVNNYGVFKKSKQTGGVFTMNWDTSKVSQFEIILYLFDSEGNADRVIARNGQSNRGL